MAASPTKRRERPAAARLVLVLALLYLFLVGVGLLEAGINQLGGDVQERLFARVANPLAGLFVGVLATVLVQSSSVTSSAIVGMVGTGIVGVPEAVPMIMGANLGTTVTNTLASLGHVRHGPEFRRAFAAATVHDMFNLLSIAVLFPIEVTTRAVSRLATVVTEPLVGTGGTTFRSPIREAVRGPVHWLESVLDNVIPTGAGLGVLMVGVGIGFIFIGLASLTRNMRVLVADRIERSINRLLTGRSGTLLALLAGVVITIAVQSSTITTAVMIPLAAAGILRLEVLYPMTLGANLGTTITALLASLATGRPESVIVAVSHLIFNVAGVLLFLPVRRLRRIPIAGAERIAEVAVRRPALMAVYVAGTFVVLPLAGLLVVGG